MKVKNLSDHHQYENLFRKSFFFHLKYLKMKRTHFLINKKGKKKTQTFSLNMVVCGIGN